MNWANYWHNMVQWYLIIVKGWPDNISFVNLSSVSSALPDLEILLHKWQFHAIHWRCLEEDEYLKLLEEHNEKLEQGKIAEEYQQTHSDKGKKHIQTSDSSQCKKAFKSTETVVSDDENDEDETALATASTHALASMNTMTVQPTATHALASPFANESFNNDMTFNTSNFLTATGPDFGNTMGGFGFDTNFEGMENLGFGMTLTS
ncbi:uncharacterized protein BJ212DRAFT_1303624 [Suillus subaureus]|uniref:Uncharacterized protein n=1 Tax=Suillus subaureus TaxID=48587 RepID=A0A9P7E0C2_9AGAM|nr:uncharacterized protein BJ212DRAFT_1303624 [Suillus subaureus]KAG1807177.1 hypothetical protein BJ212DRAFT_1303624 [Suillus subaureus]